MYFPHSSLDHFALWRNTERWSFSWRWRAAHTVYSVHYVGHLWPRSWLQREGASSNRLHFFSSSLKLLFWSVLLSRPHPLFGSQKRQMNQLSAEREFVSQKRGNKCVFEMSGTYFSHSHRDTRIIKYTQTQKTLFEWWWVISVWVPCLLEGERKTWWETWCLQFL